MLRASCCSGCLSKMVEIDRLKKKLVSLRRENADLRKIKNNLLYCALSVKQEKEFKQVFVVFDVDPY